MRAEEIGGLIEAYSKVHETPEVLNEKNLNEVSFAAGRELAGLAGLGRNVLNRSLPFLGVDTVLNTRAQEQGAKNFQQRSGGVRQGELYNASDVDSKGRPKPGAKMQLSNIERASAAPGSAAARRTQPRQNDLYRNGRNVFDGTPDPRANRPSGNPSRNPPPAPGNGSGGTGGSTPSNVISAKNIAGQQQKVTVGKGYEATLGGQKGKVTYDASGKRTFKADTSTATSTPTSTPNAQKPTKPQVSAMDQWRAANPKLAAAADEKARIRGTAQSDNPLLDKMGLRSGMRAGAPTVQSPTLAKDLGKGSGNQSLLDNPNAGKSPAPKPPKPTFQSIEKSQFSSKETPEMKKASENLSKNPLKSSLDIFDLVKGYLLDEGYAETEQNAMVIMVNMSEEWRSEILDELYKGKHGQSEKEYMAGRSDAGKRISGDEKEGPASYASRWHKGSEPTKPGEKPKNVQKLAKWEKDHLEIRKNDLKKKEEEKKGVTKESVSYSATAARAGKDIGKPGKMFGKIAKEAGERYGSKERGEKVAGAVLAKLRKEEVEQLDEISQKTATRAYAASKTGEFEGADSDRDVKRTDNLKKHIVRKFGKEAGEHADKAAEAQTFGRKDASGKYKGLPKSRIEKSDYRTTQDGKMHKQDQRELKTELRIKRDRRLRKEDLEAWVNELIAEGYDLSGYTWEEVAEIYAQELELVEAQRARENPEGHDKEEKRKYEPVRGERTPMPPRGDKRREEFEKWYAKQMGR